MTRADLAHMFSKAVLVECAEYLDGKRTIVSLSDEALVALITIASVKASER